MSGKFGTHLWLLLAKEFRLEGAARARSSQLWPFAVLVLLLFSFAAGPEPRLMARMAPGYLWLAILLASVLGLGESMALERRDGAMEGLRLLGVGPVALFLAKALSNWLCLGLLAAVLVPVAVALYGAALPLGTGPLVGVLVLGTGAISAPGTLLAALAGELEARDLVLPLLLFPLLVPGLLAAVRATSLVMLGDPMAELGGWCALLACFNGIYWLLCAVLFERVVEA